MATASARRSSSERNGSGSGRRGTSPSWSPQTNTARKRRARIASGSASSTPGSLPDSADGSRTRTGASPSTTSAAVPSRPGSARGQPAQLRARRAQVARHAGVGQVLRREHLRAAPVRRRPDRLRLRLDRGEQRLGALVRGRGEPVERRQLRLPEPRLPHLAGRPARCRSRCGGRAPRAGRPARGRRSLPGRAQPGQQVGGGAAVERRPRAGQHARARAACGRAGRAGRG